MRVEYYSEPRARSASCRAAIRWRTHPRAQQGCHRFPDFESEAPPGLVESLDPGGCHSERRYLHVGGVAWRPPDDRPDGDATALEQPSAFTIGSTSPLFQ